MKKDDWIHDSSLKGIDEKKLEFLKNLNPSGNMATPAALMAFFSMSQSQMKKSKISFSDSEIQLIFEVLKKGKSPSEIKKMDKMIEMIHLAQKK